MKLPHPYRYLLWLALLLTACEKEIDIDYHTMGEPLRVVEAALSQEELRVRITQTQDMADDAPGIGIDGAEVVLTSGDSIEIRVPGLGDGFYISRYHGVTGLRYRLDIDLEGRHYSSVSEMPGMPTVKSFRFVWKRMFSEDVLLGDLRLQDIPNATNYYFLHMYRNGLGYRWALLRDNQRDETGELQQLFTCCRRRDIEEGDSDALMEGDAVRIVVRSIDRRAYDYLYSMQVMDNTGTNPIANFAGGCLGYFSAHCQTELTRTFTLSDVEEE